MLFEKLCLICLYCSPKSWQKERKLFKKSQHALVFLVRVMNREELDVIGSAGCSPSLWSLAVDQSTKLNISMPLSQSWRSGSWRKVVCPASEENQSYYGVESISFLPYLTFKSFFRTIEHILLKMSTGKFQVSAWFDFLPLAQISCNLAPIKMGSVLVKTTIVSSNIRIK